MNGLTAVSLRNGSTGSSLTHRGEGKKGGALVLALSARRWDRERAWIPACAGMTEKKSLTRWTYLTQMTWWTLLTRATLVMFPAGRGRV